MNFLSTLSQIRDRLPSLPPGINQSRLAMFAVTLIIFGIALGGLEAKRTGETPAFSSVVAIDLPNRDLPNQTFESAFTNNKSVTSRNPVVPLSSGNQEPEWALVKVKNGQSLDAIFRTQGFTAGLLHNILSLNEDTKNLKKIKPGDVFGFRVDEAGKFSSMRYSLDESSYLIVSETDQGLAASTLKRQISSKIFEGKGSIDSSLFLAGKAAGLSDGMVMKLANIFGWDIDFVLDIRAGDRFSLIFQKLYRDGEYLRDGEILAATFTNQGEKFQAIRFEADNGPQYYAPDGRHMRKAFLRAPLNFSYISSNFNPKRFHPILKRVSAHNGIDYRAPKGTPVFAAGDGRVTRSAYSQYNGHHVFIQHANSIVTKYLHFTNRAVKQGQRVRQGEVIGYVGATGLAEAPHLHYEFVVNGAHRNPRTVSLPAVKPLEGKHLESFKTHAAPFLSQLARLDSASLYAGTR
jgi:murein DD-endopeptidase MepM/ murein hydrolase activator NlpD